MTAPEVLISTRSSTGIIELNRPKALNALTPEMVSIITAALEEWRDDPEVHRVVVISNSEKGFCAGGDIKVVRERAIEGDHEFGDQFLQAEYTMNAMIANFSKPYVAIIDGVVMGGGLGVSAHGSHRIVSEKAFAAMPETAIGFVPDVGISWMSTHVENVEGEPMPAVAKFAGITGYRMSTADMLFTGLATHFVRSEKIAEFTEVLIEESIDEAIEQFAGDWEEESFLKTKRPVIEECFGHDTWAEIDAALENCEDKEFVDLVWDLLSSANPASIVAATELYTANAEASTVEKGLAHEYAIGAMLRRQPNFVEGVRAVLVDKDRSPSFTHDSALEVDPLQYRSVLS